MAPMAASVKQISAHPLCPVTASEIKRSAELIKNLYPSKTKFQFKAITLEEPEKAQLVPYLEAEHKGARLPKIDRKVFVSYYLRNTVSKNVKGACMPMPKQRSTDLHVLRTNFMKLSSISRRTG
jgi:primary-amine oxidase